MSKVDFCRQKSKFVLFSHEIVCCKTFQMTYYLFIYDIPNRSCVILKYSSVKNYIWRITQSKFGNCVSLAMHTYSKAFPLSFQNIQLLVISFLTTFRHMWDMVAHWLKRLLSTGGSWVRLPL